MSGRWADVADQPVAMLITDLNDKPAYKLHDINLYNKQSTCDLGPGDSQKLDVVVQLDDESECYGWNNESYFHNWRHQDRKLSPGEYLVEITVTSGRDMVKKVFRITNGGHRDKLDLKYHEEDQNLTLFHS